MLQASVPNVSSVFSEVRYKCVYLDVTYVSHICCKCFIWMLRMFSMVFKCFYVFLHASVSVVLDVRCKCFIYVLQY